MIKETLLLVGVLALGLAATLNTTEIEGCKYKDELWGSVDGTKFYYCIPGTNTSIEQSCPSNTFFVKNSTVSGCVPIDLVDTHCVYVRPVEPEPCQGKNVWQPQPSKYPTQYYVCAYEGANPIALECESGKAFVTEDGYLGCVEWAEWRKIRKCPE